MRFNTHTITKVRIQLQSAKNGRVWERWRHIGASRLYLTFWALHAWMCVWNVGEILMSMCAAEALSICVCVCACVSVYKVDCTRFLDTAFSRSSTKKRQANRKKQSVRCLVAASNSRRWVCKRERKHRAPFAYFCRNLSRSLSSAAVAVGVAAYDAALTWPLLSCLLLLLLLRCLLLLLRSDY